MNLLLKSEVYAIVGAAFEVYNTLGPGFLEAVYQEALAIELTERQIPFTAQQELRLVYQGQPLRKVYLCDFLCYGSVVVEIKAANHLTDADQSQLLNYLKAAGRTTGVLLNFGSAASLEWKRMVLTLRGSRQRCEAPTPQPIREDSRRFADQALSPTGS